VPLGLRVVDQHLDHRRHQQRLLDVALFNCLQHPDRVEPRQRHLGHPQQHALDPDGEAGQVEGRGDQQVAALVRGPGQRAHAAQGGDEDAPVAEHDPLGQAGGPAGVEDARQL
jgi:hypothetical protein